MQLTRAFSHSDSIVALVSFDDGSFVDVNPAFERIVGWPRDEVVGLKPVEINLWPDFRTRSEIWSLLQSQRTVRRYPLRVQTRSGQVIGAELDCELIEADAGVQVFCLMRVDKLPADESRGLQDHPESYRALFNAAAEGMYRSIPRVGFVDVNPAMARIFGFESADEMLRICSRRDPATFYVDPAHQRHVHSLLDCDGRIVEVRSEMYRVDGSRIWISENSRAVRDAEGRLLFYEGTVVDITDRIASEAALRESEALYKVLVDNCRDGVFLIQRGHVMFANRALAQMLGYVEAELIGKSYMDLIAEEDRSAQQARRSVRESGSRDVQRYEIQMLHRDGHRLQCSVHADAVQYRDDIASTGIIRDVTEERRQQGELEAAERRYREIFELSPAGLFRTHYDGRIAEANPRLARMLGYDSPEQLKRERNMGNIYADPADRAKLIETIVREGGIDDHEVEIVGNNNVRSWVSTSVRLIRDFDTNEPQFAGSVLDINARRQIERALQRSESKYRSLVEHSQSGVFVSKGDRYMYVNQRLCEMLGYSEAELLQMDWRDLVDSEFQVAAQERTRRLRDGESLPPEFESCYRRKDGSLVYVTVSIGPIDFDGETRMTGTVRDITLHREAEQRLRFNATHDPLTGLPNRLLFQRRLDQVLKRARALGDFSYAVLFLDLDGFKLVNDSLGHAAGDRLLVVIAELLSRTLGEDALVARYGGDEFTILPQRPCSREHAEQMAQRVLELFNAAFDIDSHQAFSGASVGIVLGHRDYVKPDQVLRDADTAMYRAKAAGKSGYVVFDEAMLADAQRRFQLETDFRRAIERHEFEVHYQPLVSLTDGSILGFEALVRWRHPERGLLYPGEFLHVAEESGQITQLDWWVLQEACAQVVEWQRMFAGCEGLYVNVNADERQITSPGAVDRLRRILARTGITPRNLTLEITETLFRSGRGPAIPALTALKLLGVGLSVDDFGTGYSSLDSFTSAPFDALKIDQSFIRDMETNARHRAIVRTISGFAEDLGLALTAEGVETVGQSRVLLAMGCRTAQGFLFSRALPRDAAEALLADGFPLPRAVAGG